MLPLAGKSRWEAAAGKVYLIDILPFLSLCLQHQWAAAPTYFLPGHISQYLQMCCLRLPPNSPKWMRQTSSNITIYHSIEYILWNKSTQICSPFINIRKLEKAVPLEQFTGHIRGGPSATAGREEKKKKHILNKVLLYRVFKKKKKQTLFTVNICPMLPDMGQIRKCGIV